MTTWTAADHEYMARAIDLSHNALGWASPNPAVGCVIVKDGMILGEGWTQPCGGLHAEPTALNDCLRRGNTPHGATAYVTLMPCHHIGRTPPCTERLIAEGIARVVVACDDPHPISGEGDTALRDAGIIVEVGLMEQEAAQIMAGFIQHVYSGIPRLRLKYAMSMDGKIATHTGHSQWITGEAARADVQRLRTQHDAIMVGSGTMLADDPRLTVRNDDCAFQPRRVVVDATCRFLENRTPGSFRLFTEHGGGVYIITTDQAPLQRIQMLKDTGANLIITPEAFGHVDLPHALRQLSDMGVRSILCEGGGGLAGALHKSDLIDDVIVYIAPKIIGGTSAPSPIAGAGITTMSQAETATLRSIEHFGNDIRLWFERHPLLHPPAPG